MAEPYIEVAVTNPTPSGGQPNALRNEIWRSLTGAAGSYVRLTTTGAVGQPGLYLDYQVASGKTYYYFARTYFDNGTYVDSTVATGANTWTDFSWLSLPDGTYPVMLRYNPQRSQAFDVETQLLKFDGRVAPLGYSGIGTDEVWTFKYLVSKDFDTTDQADALQDLIDLKRGRTLMWRDTAGRLLYCWVTGFGRELGMPNPRADVTFKLQRVDYTVGV